MHYGDINYIDFCFICINQYVYCNNIEVQIFNLFQVKKIWSHRLFVEHMVGKLSPNTPFAKSEGACARASHSNCLTAAREGALNPYLVTKS